MQYQQCWSLEIYRISGGRILQPDKGFEPSKSRSQKIRYLIPFKKFTSLIKLEIKKLYLEYFKWNWKGKQMHR